MKATLTWEITPEAEGVGLALIGTIDESADFVALLGQLSPGKPVRIDLSQIERISSVGVRAWISFIDKLALQQMPVALDRCSVAIVRQLGMITQFKGHATVRSVFAPYYCADCNLEQLRLIDLSGDVMVQLRTPLECPSCGAELDLDEEESLYTVLKEP